jgi:hypothetical protein
LKLRNMKKNNKLVSQIRFPASLGITKLSRKQPKTIPGSEN